MRSPAFKSEVMQRRLHSSALSWIGTPFIPHANIRGAGVDCVHLVASVLIEAGCDFVFNPPAYSMDGGKHIGTSKIVQWIEASGKFDQAVALEIGDVLLFRIGNVEHHCGVKVTPATFVHSLRGYGVIESNVADPTWVSRMTRIYRPMEESHA